MFFLYLKQKSNPMSYIRIYPNKNNTIFKSNFGSLIQKQGEVNTGKNPIFELNDGASSSRILLGFDLEELKSKLVNKSFTCNLKLYDAGALRNGGFVTKPINLYYFNSVFVEGNGFGFSDASASVGISNWNKRTNNDSWTTEFDTPIMSIQTQSQSDDLIFKNLESQVLNSINNNLECNFALNFDSFDANDVLYAKFIRSKYTRTIFKPYLEFFINDSVIDSRYNLKKDISSPLYLINWNLEEISNLTVEVEDLQSSEITTPSITYDGNGIHRYNFTPLTNGEYVEIWKTNGEVISKSMLITKPIFDISQNQYSSLYFYPTTYYNKNLIRKGDLVKINLIAKSNRKNFVSSFFEYKILTTSEFEICPWMPVSVYGNEMYFYMDTSYFFEEIEYEIIVRFKNGERTQTSVEVYKFRVTFDGPSKFDGVDASPYSDREIYLKK